jgi:CubicO group peptidase (beta-lactamase class C family)
MQESRISCKISPHTEISHYAAMLCALCMLISPAFTSAEQAFAETNTMSSRAVEDIDAVVAQYLQNYRSISMAVVVGDDIVLSKSYGKNTLSRRQVCASVSKPVTAMIVLQLWQEGRIRSLDDDIGGYSEKYRNAVPQDCSDTPITFRHLLSHKAGIPHQGRIWKREVGTSRRGNRKKLNLLFCPGTGARYSTRGYGVLGEVIEELTDKSYDTLVKEYIGEPVGASSFRADDLFFETPGGRVWSTIHDMALFAHGVMHGIYVTESILYREAFRAYAVDRTGDVGLGWFINNIDTEDITVFHAGSNGRPRAYLMMKPKKKIAVALMGMNRSSQNADDFAALAGQLMSIVESHNPF